MQPRTQPATLPASPERSPVPPEAERAAAAGQVREVFRADIAGAKTPSQKAAVVWKILDAAAASGASDAERFAMCETARAIALEAGDVEDALRATEELAGDFEIDWKSEAQVLGAILKAARQPRDYAALATYCDTAASHHLNAEQFDAAAALADLAASAGRSSKDPSLQTRTADRVRSVRDARALHAAVEPARAALRADRNDPAANLTLGKYLCFVKNDWSAGLPLLARGGDTRLKSLAERELRRPSDIGEQLSLADGWFDLAAELKDPRERRQARRHAGQWYRQCLPTLAGLQRVKATRRLEEIFPPVTLNVTEYTWKRGSPRVVPASGDDDDLCLLGGVSGNFAGGGEVIRLVPARDGPWSFECKTQQPLGATALAVKTKFPGAFKLQPEIHRWKRGDPPLRLIHHDEGFCILSALGGAFDGGGEEVRLHIGDDGFWYLSGRAKRGVLVEALCFRTRLPRGIRLEFREHEWRAGGKPVSMLPREEGWCYLSSIGGDFGPKEVVSVGINADGQWQLSGQSNHKAVVARAIAVRVITDE